MKTEQKEVKPRYGIANLKEEHTSRFPCVFRSSITSSNSPANRTGHLSDASEGGLQITFFPEQVEVGQTERESFFLNRNPD